MLPELWSSIPDFSNYEVSSLGNVRRITNNTSGKAGNLIAGYRDKDGYHIVILYANGTKKQNKVHRLVTSAFIGMIPKGMHVNHKNGVRDDNQVINLEIVTPSENMRHSFDVLGRKPSVFPRAKGINHPNSRFVDAEIVEIRRLYALGTSQIKIAKLFNTGQNHISRIVRRESWSHVK